MGGDYVPSNDGDSCSGDDFSLLSYDSTSFLRDDLGMRVEHGMVNGGNRVDIQESGENGTCPSGLDFEVNERRRHRINREILQSYDDLKSRCENLKEAKEKILSYSPGAWTEKVGGHDHEVPKTTCLILVGPKASGKSSLINRISKVFEDDKFAPARAQVSYNSPIGDGTYFLQEFMIPRDSTSFCLYDTRSLSDDSHENDRMLSCWMTKGVRHGELVVRNTDDQTLRRSLKFKTRHNDSISTTRRVNFVIYVVSGLSVLKAMESTSALEAQYLEAIASTFNCPYLSFKDDKPALVVTHGDLLSLSDRARVRAHLGKVLGIPPAKQIFDISECDDPVTDFTITEMLRYSLEHADKNYPLKSRVIDKVYKATQPSLYMIILNLLLLGVAVLLSKDMFIGTFHFPRAYSGKPHASNHVKPNFPSYQAKQEAPPPYAQPEVPSWQETEIPSHDSAKPEVPKHQTKPNIASYDAKQEIPPHHAEAGVSSRQGTEVPSHESAKLEVPSLQETDIPSHDSAKPEVPKHHAKPKIASHHAKQGAPPDYAEPIVPPCHVTKVHSHDSAKPKVAFHHAEQEVPPHYTEPELSSQVTEIPSHDAAKPKVSKHQELPKSASHHVKQEVPHYSEAEVPSRAAEVPSHEAAKLKVPERQAKPKIASHHAKQEVPPRYVEPEISSPQVMEIPSHDAAKPKVSKHQELPKNASHRAKQEIPHYSEPEVSSRQAEVPSHDAANPKVPKHQAKPKVPKHQAKQKVPSHHEKPVVRMTEPKIVWHKIRHMWL